MSALVNQMPLRGVSREGYQVSTLDNFEPLRRHISDKKNATTVLTEAIFCDEKRCYGELSEGLLYYDDDHPSEYV